MNRDLKQIIAKHAKEVISYLITQDLHFSVQCGTSFVQFDPPLPHEISSQFHPIIDFILAGFTFESIEIWEDEMSFEAGFGKDNFSSLVVIPFTSIIQISLPTNNSIMRDVCIFMNAMNYIELEVFRSLNEESVDDIQEYQEVKNDDFDSDLLESSKNAILSNPNNKFD